MNKNFVTLALAALVLVGLVFAIANPFKDSIRSDNPERVDLVDAAAIRGADHLQIRIAGKDDVVLKRGGDQWVVESQGGFPADTSAVSAVLGAVAGAKSLKVVSANPEKRGKFQVDETGVEVTVFAGGQELSHLWVGKAGTDFSTSYVRMDDADPVHVVRGINRNMVDRYRGFRDHTLLKFDLADVSGVMADLPAGGWELARGDTAWIVTPSAGEAVGADDTQVDTFLRALSNVAADGFADTGVDGGRRSRRSRLPVHGALPQRLDGGDGHGGHHHHQPALRRSPRPRRGLSPRQMAPDPARQESRRPGAGRGVPVRGTNGLERG